MDVLQVDNLVKDYGPPKDGFRAVDHISFTVPMGKIIGLLGPNGAGKTTTIQILMGITLPSSGKITYFGKDFFLHREECLQRLNIGSSYGSLMGRLTCYENLMVFAHLYRVPNPKKKITELALKLEVEDVLHKAYWDISAGQKTRVNLMKAFINDPELVLLDEPTAALDPDISDKLLGFLERQRHEAKLSVLYTSHQMDEVARICDEVIIMDRGRIVAQDTPLGLTKHIPHSLLQITFDAPKKIVREFLTKNDYAHTFLTDFIVEIKLKEKYIPTVIFDLGHEKVWITDIEVKKPTLEDVFLQIARDKISLKP